MLSSAKESIINRAPLLNRLGVVLPRYGESLGGGAETLVRELVRHALMAEQPLVREVEILTTCARDHRTWANELPAGQTFDGPISVRRFPVDERNIGEFIRCERAMQEGRALTPAEQLSWLTNSVNSRELYAHLHQHGTAYDAILFAPYLFATTFFGGLVHPERSIIIPCLHDEHYAYQGVFRELFRRVRGVIFNAEPEKDLFKEIYALPDANSSSEFSGTGLRSAVVGMGFEPLKHAQDNSQTADETENDLPTFPYLIYSGRKEKGKNLDLLLRYFQIYRDFTASRGVETPLQLVIIGSGTIDFCDSLPEGVHDLGFVSEAKKLALLRNATALVQPSQNESFSIVLMEAWQCGCPVVVHAGCPVTRYHAVASGGGLYFATPEEFCGVLQSLASNSSLRNDLAAGGREYVSQVYSWDAVLDRFRGALSHILA